ncbi:MAG: dTMP kinase [Ruminococcaceae bacterium]|nr:dTMP kinase [Oscillospiraceae bacterium]
MSKFIVVEGLDGTGKTTQIKILADYIRKKDREVEITAEPTAHPTGKLIRKILSGEVKSTPWALASLFLSDRIVHNTDPEDGIEKMLSDGKTVISDRYYYSTFSYQGHETDLDWAMNMHFSCPEVRRPDLVLFLTMEPEKCIERIRANRPDEAIEIYENTESLTKISRQFDTVFSILNEDENIVYIDADGTVEEVSERLFEAYDTYCGE